MEDEIQELKSAIKEAIDQVIDRFGCEDFYEIDCTLIQKDTNFNKWKEHKIIEPVKCFCIFCQKEAYYYLDEICDYVCVKCYKELQDETRA